jgi:hypothetical protein
VPVEASATTSCPASTSKRATSSAILPVGICAPPKKRLTIRIFTSDAYGRFSSVVTSHLLLLTRHRGEAACHTTGRNLRAPEETVNKKNFHD